MTDKQHETARASMLCIIAFTLGLIVCFCTGCASGVEAKTRVFKKDLRVGVGGYVDDEFYDVDEH